MVFDLLVKKLREEFFKEKEIHKNNKYDEEWLINNSGGFLINENRISYLLGDGLIIDITKNIFDDDYVINSILEMKEITKELDGSAFYCYYLPEYEDDGMKMNICHYNSDDYDNVKKVLSREDLLKNMISSIIYNQEFGTNEKRFQFYLDKIERIEIIKDESGYDGITVSIFSNGKIICKRNIISYGKTLEKLMKILNIEEKQNHELHKIDIDDINLILENLKSENFVDNEVSENTRKLCENWILEHSVFWDDNCLRSINENGFNSGITKLRGNRWFALVSLGKSNIFDKKEMAVSFLEKEAEKRGYVVKK